MIKVRPILLVAFILGQSLGAQIFQIDWVLNRRNRGGDSNVYEVSENQTSTSNNNDTNRIFSIEERVLNVEKDVTATSTSATETTSTTAETTTEAKIPQVTQGDVNEFGQKMRMFAANFYSQVLEDADTNENIIYSPISITHAMGMINTGARGNSSRQIKESLYFDADTDNSYIDSLFRNITSSKFNDSMELRVIKLMVARSFIQKGFTVRPEFLKAIETKYHSDIASANFLFPKEATNQINQWVEEQTNQLIKNLLSPGVITVDTRLVLVNAIYFKAPWTTKFSEVSEHAFTTPTGKVTVPFMTETIRCRYHVSSYTQFIAIPYDDGETYFFIILPESNDGTEAAAASAVVVAGRTLVKEVYVDRPFLFGVIESKGNILFMGKVVNPSGK